MPDSTGARARAHRRPCLRPWLVRAVGERLAARLERAAPVALAVALVAVSAGPAVGGPAAAPPAGAGADGASRASVADAPARAVLAAPQDDVLSARTWRPRAADLTAGPGPAPTPAPAAAVEALAATSARVPAGAPALPERVLAAYGAAQERLRADDPRCGLSWWLLAGVGKVESGHAGGGRVDADGRTRGEILGPRLDGSLAGTARIDDSDGGALDGDPAFDRAVGPMQFLPGTWRGWGADADGDGRADPHDVDDAALSAGRYLCLGGADLTTPAGQTAALMRYNRSVAYGQDVLAWGAAYRDGVQVVGGASGSVAPPRPAPAPAPVPAPEPAPVVEPAGDAAAPVEPPPADAAPAAGIPPADAAPPVEVQPVEGPALPDAEPTVEPLAQPTAEPLAQPTAEPLAQASGEPTDEPSGEPADARTEEPAPVVACRDEAEAVWVDPEQLLAPEDLPAVEAEEDLTARIVAELAAAVQAALAEGELVGCTTTDGLVQSSEHGPSAVPFTDPSSAPTFPQLTSPEGPGPR